MVADGYSCGSTKVSSRLTWVVTVLTILLLTVDWTPAAAFEFSGIPGGFAPADGSSGFDQSMSSADTSIYGAILIPNRSDGQFHAITIDNGSVLGITTSGRHKYPQRGGWAGVSQKIALNNGLDLVLEGWAQIPSNSHCFSDYEFLGSGNRNQRAWGKTDCTLWYVDAAVYGAWLPGWTGPGWSQINGLRFDYYFRRMTDPGPFDEASAPFPSNPSDTLEMTAKWVTPYLGIQYRSDTGLTVATLRFLVAPFAFGALTHEEQWFGADPTGRKDEASFTFKQSWFFEFYGDGLLNVTRDSAVGGFLKMTHIDAISNSNFKSTLGSGVQETADSHLVFRRLGYAFGAKVNVKFATPL